MREGFTPENDIDVLVKLEQGQTPGLSFFAMEEELTHILGRKVDFLTEKYLSPLIWAHAKVAAVTIY